MLTSPGALGSPPPPAVGWGRPSSSIAALCKLVGGGWDWSINVRIFILSMEMTAPQMHKGQWHDLLQLLTDMNTTCFQKTLTDLLPNKMYNCVSKMFLGKYVNENTIEIKTEYGSEYQNIIFFASLCIGLILEMKLLPLGVCAFLHVTWCMASLVSKMEVEGANLELYTGNFLASWFQYWHVTCRSMHLIFWGTTQRERGIEISVSIPWRSFWAFLTF